ncbi:translation elongation factor 4 [bacterium]|nr:translation elongation factor 4 [bacterium]
MEQKYIRNFCIIAHIDHGKSTLADRFLELTKTVPPGKMRPQYLDRMPLERERGITIKLQPVRMIYKTRIHADIKRGSTRIKTQIYADQDADERQQANKNINNNQQEYILNLIDTPGHVDFSYEVSRSLAAVEGAILLVDAREGIQAQTLANLYLAQKQGLTILPVINKIDLPNLDIPRIKKELSNLLQINENEILLVSAKYGINIENVLEKIVETFPSPKGDKNKPLRALIFDSIYDEYRGVIVFVRIFDGKIIAGEKIKMLKSQAVSEVLEVGVFNPNFLPQKELEAGEIGYIVTGLKEIEKCRVGDTITLDKDQKVIPLPGYQEPKPMVFAGFFSKDGNKVESLRRALQKLKLNDASLTFEPERSPALGFGFRCGFLGLLHLDITRERIKQEYGLDLIITTPTVGFKVFNKNGKSKIIKNPIEIGDLSKIDHVEEPIMNVDIIVPIKFIGKVMDLIKEYRGEFLSTEYLTSKMPEKYQRIIIHSKIPLAMLIVDFYNKLKSISSGYASLSYEFNSYRTTEIEKLNIFIAGRKVEELTTIVYKDGVYRRAKKIVETLKNILPRQLFEVKIQAATGDSIQDKIGKVIASERIAPFRKDVTAKLYGGDVTRKMKLLKKQKKGKKKLAQFGKINIPSKVYLEIFKI